MAYKAADVMENNQAHGDWRMFNITITSASVNDRISSGVVCSKPKSVSVSFMRNRRVIVDDEGVLKMQLAELIQ